MLRNFRRHFFFVWWILIDFWIQWLDWIDLKCFQNFNFTASNLWKYFNQPSNSNFLHHKLLQIHFAHKLYFKTIASTSIRPQEASDFFMSAKIFFGKMEHTLWQLQFLSLMFRGFMRCVILWLCRKEYWGHYSAIWKPVNWPRLCCHRCRVRMSGKSVFPSVIISNWLFMTV